MPLSEIIPSSIKIDKLLNRIGEGDIKIPAFQRGFVWNQEQVLDCRWECNNVPKMGMKSVPPPW